MLNINGFNAIRLPEDYKAQEVPVAEQVGVSRGFRADVSPLEIPLDGASDLESIRFEQNGIRRDFGLTTIGTAAVGRILGLVEYKFVRDGLEFTRLVRLYRNGTGNAVLQAWGGSSWVTLNTSVPTINDVYLSSLAIQDRLLVADGSNLLAWYEGYSILPTVDTFPSGTISTVGSSKVVPLSAVANDGTYTILYDTTITGASPDGIAVEVALLIGGVEVDTQTFRLEPSDNDDFSRTWTGESFEWIDSTLAAGTNIEIKFKTLTRKSSNKSLVLSNVGTNTVIGTKASSGEAIAGYMFMYDIDVNAGVTARVSFYYRTSPTVAWVLFDSVSYSPGASKNLYVAEIHTIDPVPLLGTNSQFMVVAENIAGGMDGVTLSSTVTVLWDTQSATFIDPTDVRYNVNGPVVSTLDKLEGAPAARYLGSIANRVLAIQDGGDVQVLAWCANGDMTTWSGPGTGRLYLIDSSSDPIDALMGFAMVGHAIGALFRQRSINRVVETGNPLQAIGVVDWITGVGTDSPFSIQQTPYGIMFLGHDMMPYKLTQAGIEPVGIPVRDELIATVQGNLDKVDSAYDPVFSEYFLGVCTGGSDTINTVWIMNMERGEPRWRKRTLNVQRMAVTSKVE